MNEFELPNEMGWFRQLFEASPDPAWIVIDNRFAACNDAAVRALGYATREALLGVHPSKISPPQQPDRMDSFVKAEMMMSFALEKSLHRFEWVHRRTDGSDFFAEVTLSLVVIENQPAFYAIWRDISDRKAAEQALRNLNEALESRVAMRTAELDKAWQQALESQHAAEAANAAKSEFLSRMSHELRTPLNVIIGFAQMLTLPGKSSLTEQQADNVQEILKAGQHLLVQVNEVLDLARIESGRIELSLEPLPLASLIKDCVSQVQLLAAARGITIATSLEEAVAVQGDYTRVKQVLLNLLSNAIKYNRDDRQIHVAAVATGEQMRVEVRDTGRGISPEQRARLFKPFERLESSYDGIEGSGIGLALVKRLVEAMGGEIGVDSEEGLGSTFWFILPAATLPSLPDTEPPKIGASGTAIATDVAKASQYCVLYIEDNPANLKLIKKIIGLRPELVMFDAMNAELGLEIARRERPDLILLDINLPGMDGFAAITQLKEWPETAQIPVIAVTANAMKRGIERGNAAGFADYLTKPIDIVRLNQILDGFAAGKVR